MRGMSGDGSASAWTWCLDVVALVVVPAVSTKSMTHIFPPHMFGSVEKITAEKTNVSNKNMYCTSNQVCEVLWFKPPVISNDHQSQAGSPLDALKWVSHLKSIQRQVADACGHRAAHWHWHWLCPCGFFVRYENGICSSANRLKRFERRFLARFWLNPDWKTIWQWCYKHGSGRWITSTFTKKTWNVQWFLEDSTKVQSKIQVVRSVRLQWNSSGFKSSSKSYVFGEPFFVGESGHGPLRHLFWQKNSSWNVATFLIGGHGSYSLVKLALFAGISCRDV